MLPSKPGKDQQYDPRNQQEESLPGDPKSKGNQRGQAYREIPIMADKAQWDDKRNYDQGLANVTPMSGLECTAYQLCNIDKGVSVDNVVTTDWSYKPGRS